MDGERIFQAFAEAAEKAYLVKNSSKTFGQNFKLTHHKWKWNWNWKGDEAEQVNNLVSRADWRKINDHNHLLYYLLWLLA